MKSLLRRMVLAVLCVLAAGCSLDLTQLENAPRDVNQCEQTADCRSGVCSLGRCVATQGEFDTVLLEITPPSSAARVGGVRFLQTLTDMGQSRRRNIELRPPALVTGFVRAYDKTALAGCLNDNLDSLPVEVTLTPRSRILGLPSSSYTTRTVRRSLSNSAEAARHPCNREMSNPIPEGVEFQEYTLIVPAGEYDIYVRSALGEDASRSCQITPYLKRKQDIPAGDVCAILWPGTPERFSASIAWPATDEQTLHGWRAEIIHPVTGEVLSTSQSLQSAVTNGETQEYELELSYRRAEGADYGPANEELLRLTPPEPDLGPVIQLSLQLLDPFGDDKISIPSLRPFPAPVQLEIWVLEEEQLRLASREVGVAASVTFTATQLDGISSGVFASFSTTVESTGQGRLTATVLPGEYRVRVVPAAGSGLAATEGTLTVPCERSPVDPTQCLPRQGDVSPRVQAGRTFLVPRAATVSGRARLFDMSGSLRDATVDAKPGQIRARRCATDRDAGECELAPLDVLEVSLGEQAFVPRSESVLTDERGRFSMRLDCGMCDSDGGAIFDLLVRPQAGAGFPWLVNPGLSVHHDVALGDINLPLPIVQRGVVQIPQSSSDPVRIPGALIRAYIHRDALGRYVADPADRPNCSVELAETRCLRSILQIGEARAAADGSYELVLPSRLE